MRPALMWNLSDYGEHRRVRLTPESEADVCFDDSLLSIGGLQALLQYKDIQDSLQQRGSDVQHFVRSTLLDFLRDEQIGEASCHVSPVSNDIGARTDAEDVVYRIIESRKHRGRNKYKGQLSQHSVQCVTGVHGWWQQAAHRIMRGCVRRAVWWCGHDGLTPRAKDDPEAFEWSLHRRMRASTAAVCDCASVCRVCGS